MKVFLKSASLTLISLSFLFTSSCSSKQAVEPIDYLSGTHRMDLKKFFDGDIDAFAIKQNTNGKIIGTATIKIEAEWDGSKGVIKKNFSYNTGKKDSRTWLITLEQDGTFNAVGHDVATPARGKQVGNAAQSIYSLMLKGNNGKQEVLFEDRMYLVNKNSMIIISNFKQKNASNSPDNHSAGKYIISLKKLSKEDSEQDKSEQEESEQDE